MTHLFIAQSIVRAPDFRGTTLRVAMHTESAVTDCYEIVPVSLKLKNFAGGYSRAATSFS